MSSALIYRDEQLQLLNEEMTFSYGSSLAAF